jgi:hypothetical protein
MWFNSLFQTVLIAWIALVAQSGAAMLISVRRWERRHNPRIKTLIRLLALLVIGGMVVVGMATGAWLMDLWDVLPMLNSGFPGMPIQLILGFLMMVVAIMIALVAFIHGIFAQRALDGASPKQDDIVPPRSLDQQNLSSPSYQTEPKV